jgi:signal transduction histidine kinase/CheY-like chemotaxis protein
VEPTTIASYIESRKAGLLRHWRDLAEAHPHKPTQHLSDEEVEDHLPVITEQIIRALRGKFTDDEIDRDGRIHGHRRRQDGYSVGDVAWELSLYRHLLVILVDEALSATAEPHHGNQSRNLVMHLMDRCLRTSIEQFVFEAEQERAKAQTETQQLLEQRDRFLLTLSHELRNQVSPIMLAVRLLENSHFSDPRQQRAVRIIERQARHQSALINDLLDIDRYRFGRLALRKEVIDLREPLEHALETCLPEAEVKSLSVQINLPTEKMASLADRDRVVQIVTNLVNNAIRFTPPNGVINIALAREADFVVLRVKDSGIGISAEALPHIFDLFFQASDATTRGMGLGVGLALVKSLVEMHSGQIEAFSEGEKKGSEFIVRFIAASPNEASATPQPQNAILVVDDSPDQLQILGDVLSDLGHHVVQAATAADALALAAEVKPVACVVDIGLPDIDGYELARRLREALAHPGLLLIATSGWGAEDDKRRAMEAGFDHHLTKPVDVDELHALLKGSETARD